MSEVARLRAQIARDYEAAYNGLHGFAVVAKVPHLHRTECTERISEAHQHLSELVGIEEATQIVSDVMDSVKIESQIRERML